MQSLLSTRRLRSSKKLQKTSGCSLGVRTSWTARIIIATDPERTECVKMLQVYDADGFLSFSFGRDLPLRLRCCVLSGGARKYAARRNFRSGACSISPGKQHESR